MQLEKRAIDGYKRGMIIPLFLKLKNAINPQHFECYNLNGHRHSLHFQETQFLVCINNIVIVAINVWLTISPEPQAIGHGRQTHFTDPRSSTLGQYMSVLASTVVVETYQCRH